MAFLQKLCANDIDIPVGHVSPSGMHNEQGGYENDCMLIREQPNWYNNYNFTVNVVLTFSIC